MHFISLKQTMQNGSASRHGAVSAKVTMYQEQATYILAILSYIVNEKVPILTASVVPKPTVARGIALHNPLLGQSQTFADYNGSWVSRSVVYHLIRIRLEPYKTPSGLESFIVLQNFNSQTDLRCSLRENIYIESCQLYTLQCLLQ